MSIKMIVCDLDGTLLRSDKTVSKYTLDMLNKCRSQGVKFAIATARSVIGAGIFTKVMPPDVLIYNGGAAAVIGGDIIYNQEICGGTATQIIREILKLGHTYVFAENDHAFFYNSPGDYPYAMELAHCGLRVVQTDFARGIDEPVHKVRTDVDMNIAQDIADKFDCVSIISYHGESWVRFGHVYGTKWRAVEACAMHLGIDAAEIAAFGDDYNDVEMLKNCGIGVAMANAIPEAKAAANFVCDDNGNDGVAKWLEENVISGGI